MSKPNSTYRRSTDSTFNPQLQDDATAVADRLRYEWQQTGIPDLPAAIAKSPCLLSNRSVLLDLVQDEFRELRSSSNDISPAEYCGRFPGLDHHLLQSIHRLIETEQFLGDHPDLLQILGSPNWPGPDQVFEGFYLVEELGRGAVSRVFLAKQLELGARQVVLKITQGTCGEASTLGKLQHPNVVTVYSTGMEASTELGWICMPMLGRSTLADALSKTFTAESSRRRIDLPLLVRETNLTRKRYESRRVYEESVVHIAAQLAGALDYVHRLGLLHGDLKPSNVLLTDDGVPMLIDFNLARDLRTENALIGGTLPYMAPEQLQALERSSTTGGNPVTPASEIFSFGVLLYQLLTGQMPFACEESNNGVPRMARELLDSHQRRQLELEGDLSGYDPRLNQLVRHCLQPQPSDRPVSFEEVSQALNRLRSFRSRLLRSLYYRPRAVLAVITTAVLAASVAMASISRLAEDSTLATASRHIKTKDYAGAASLLRPFVRAHPEDYDAKRSLARCLIETKQYSAAIGHHMALWRAEDKPLDLAMVGYCRNLEGAHEFAIRSYEDAQSAGVTNAALENNLAASLVFRLSRSFRAETSQEVEKLLMSAHRRCSDNPTICVNMMGHFLVVSQRPHEEVPNYPVGIAGLQRDSESCRRAVEFLVARHSTIQELQRYGLPNLRYMAATGGIESIDRRLSSRALRMVQEIPGFDDLAATPGALVAPSPPIFLDPAKYATP